MSYFKSPVPKPSVQEIARGLISLGLVSSAAEMLRSIGISELPALPAEKPKYVREKIKSAYVYPKVQATLEQQKIILEAFRQEAIKSNPWLPNLDEALIEIVLPKAKVVYAYRLPMKEYSSSTVPEILANSRVLAAYTRKPRSDAQHHKQSRSN
jgi:hypothetical protein